MKRLIIKEIEGDAKQYGDARRTLIEAAERAVAEQKLVDEPVTVVVSEKGWLRARTGHGHDPAQFTFKAGDALYGTFECRTVDALLAFGSNGRIYSVPVALLPNARGDGAPITTMIELASGTRLLHYFAGSPDTVLMMASTAGYGFTAKAGDMVSRIKAGKAFMTVDEGDEPLLPRVQTANAGALTCLSAKGKLLVFGMDEIKTLSGGGRGVTLMDLEPGEKLLVALPISEKGVVVVGTTPRGKAVQEELKMKSGLSHHIGKRARKGKALESKIKPSGLKLP
jgi:topoisomerase-4 subunit A